MIDTFVFAAGKVLLAVVGGILALIGAVVYSTLNKVVLERRSYVAAGLSALSHAVFLPVIALGLGVWEYEFVRGGVTVGILLYAAMLTMGVYRLKMEAAQYGS